MYALVQGLRRSVQIIECSDNRSSDSGGFTVLVCTRTTNTCISMCESVQLLQLITLNHKHCENQTLRKYLRHSTYIHIYIYISFKNVGFFSFRCIDLISFFPYFIYKEYFNFYSLF